MRFALPLLLVLPAAPVAAQEFAPGCNAALAGLHDSFTETIARLEAAGGAGHDEKCAALHHHIDVMANGRDVFLRCLPPGHDRGENVGQLQASIEDFEYVLTTQNCP
jgi:hypothetical protein